jgi:hypothetical protein
VPQLTVRTIPQPDELWLSRPPYRMIARVLDVQPEQSGRSGSISYVLYDEDGSSLEHVSGAPLDESWWYAFQPLTKRQG